MTVCLHDPSRIMAELIDRLEITGSGASRRSEKTQLVLTFPCKLTWER